MITLNGDLSQLAFLFCHDILLKRIHWSCQLHANHGMALKRHQLQYSHDLILEDEA